MRAEGNVHIFTQTDQAWGDQATYDLDQAVLVLTGNALKLTTPNDTLTARDTMEYWSQKHMAVARGDAVVVTNDARRISADTLVAYTIDNQAGATPTAGGPTTVGPTTAGPTTGAPAGGGATASGPAAPASTAAGSGSPPRAAPNPSGDPLAAMAGRLERVEAFNNVTVRTQTDIVIGDRGVYVPDTQIAHLGGHVRITRGPNQVNGAEAVVNMKTGLATLLAGDGGHVSGLVVPNDQSNPPPGNAGQNKPAGDRPKGEQPKPAAKP